MVGCIMFQAVAKAWPCNKCMYTRGLAVRLAANHSRQQLWVWAVPSMHMPSMPMSYAHLLRVPSRAAQSFPQLAHGIGELMAATHEKAGPADMAAHKPLEVEDEIGHRQHMYLRLQWLRQGLRGNLSAWQIWKHICLHVCSARIYLLGNTRRAHRAACWRHHKKGACWGHNLQAECLYPEEACWCHHLQ